MPEIMKNFLIKTANNLHSVNKKKKRKVKHSAKMSRNILFALIGVAIFAVLNSASYPIRENETRYYSIGKRVAGMNQSDKIFFIFIYSFDFSN